MDEKANAATLDLIEQLKRDHPKDSVERLFKRYQQRLAADPTLRQPAMRGAFELLCNDLLDDLVRGGKEVPRVLRKAH